MLTEPLLDVVAPKPWFSRPARIAVLLSGRGSNFVALASACERGDVPARIVLVVSDKRAAAGLERAKERGIPAEIVERGDFPSRAAHEAEILRLIAKSDVDLVCLAGFMRVLSPAFLASFPHRILNIHPSLLPSFPGLDAQGQALRYGVGVTGATVHFVDSGVDSGPIVLQEAVAVLAGDDVETLSARILEVEHRLYASALTKLLAGGWSLVGRTLRFG